jgi:hypothetical protein
VNERSTLHWPHLRSYESCSLRFLWERGWGNVDVGGGPGNPRPLPERESHHLTVADVVIQACIAKYYNDELYREPSTASANVLHFFEAEWFRRTQQVHINYNAARRTPEQLHDNCREAVLGFLRTMRAHALLGTYSKANVELIGWIDKWNAVGGNADLIIRHRDHGISLLVGKNSKKKDPSYDELVWYALLFRLSYRQIPDRLGFLWHKFPYGDPALDKKGKPLLDEAGQPEVEQGVEWVPFTEDDVRGMAQRALDAKKQMRKKLFEASPVPSQCRTCLYESVCELRQAQKARNSAKRKKRPPLEEIQKKGGFSDFSL